MVVDRLFLCYNEEDECYTSEPWGPLHVPKEYDLYARMKSDKCYYCATRTTYESFQHINHTYYIKDAQVLDRIQYCSSCGWWVTHHCETDNESHIIRLLRTVKIRSFDIASLVAPYETLRIHLNRFPADVVHIPPKRFERLVADIFKEHLDCQVSLTQQTRDGGYDILGIDSSHGQFLIEVKRRKKKINVHVVREFAGVLLREEKDHGIIVSTSGYTRPAEVEAAVYGEYGRRHVLKLELKDIRFLTDFLKVSRMSPEGTLPRDCELARILVHLREIDGQDLRTRPSP